MEYHWHLVTFSIYLFALSSTKVTVTQKLVPGIHNWNKTLHKIDNLLNDFKNIEELIQSPSFQNILRKEVNRTIDLKIKEIQKLQKKQGCDCPRGPPGPPGAAGFQGPQGPPGIRGSRGERGPIGLGLYAPELKEQNLHIDVNITETINASCTFFGNPLPNITWQLTVRHVRFENEINRDNSEVKSIAILKNVSWIDRGLIKCIASSILGIVEANGALVVHRSPSIKALPPAIYSHMGVSFTFPRCEAIGYPDAQITWTRGFMKMDRSRTNFINQTIVFSRVNIEDEGFYVCAAKNYIGYDQKTIQFKTKPLSFARELKSFPLIRPDEKITLSCAAFGYTQEMTGSWYHGRFHRKIPSTNHSEDGLFNVTTVVNKSGIYQCEIKMNSNAIKRRIFVRDYSFGSSLLSRSQVKQLYKWVRKQKNDSEVHLHEFEQCWLMKGNNGGALYVYNYKPYEYQQKYEKQCNTEDEIILLMKDLKGNIFGGFNNRKGRNNNFLFDFKKGAMFEENSIYGGICNYFGPCFYVDLQFEKYKTFYGGFLRYSSKLNNRFNGKGYKHLGDSPSGELFGFEILHKVSRD